ncbi:MAG: tetratricopeptide repeat protein, partial [Spirochaetota bacterium]|nr:tetratricopeptide repeat protein [Spirochaetota bacterium]
KIQKFQQALYAYKRYMEHFPDTKFSSVAMDRIKAIETGTADLDFVDEMGLEDAGKQEEAVVDEDVDLTDFSIDDDSEDGIDNDIGSNKKSPIAGEIDEFFSDDTDFSFDEPEAEENGKAVNNIAENYYNAVSLFSQEKYGEALDLYEQILKIKTLKDESERKIFEKANFEIGRIYLKLGKYNEAFKSLSDMIKKFPKSDNMKNALLHIGMTFELAQKHDKAISYYNKVISIEPRDEITNQAMKRLKNIKK